MNTQHVENAFIANNPERVWDIMNTMTGMSSPAKPISTDNKVSFTDGINTLFSRFETNNN